MAQGDGLRRNVGPHGTGPVRQRQSGKPKLRESRQQSPGECRESPRGTAEPGKEIEAAGM